MNIEPWITVPAGPSVFATAVQYFLGLHGHPVTVDGDFGPLTEAAVEAFQADESLNPDGVVGADTWRKLVVQSQQGDTGDAVRAVQSFGLLRMPGDPPLVVDGDFGPLTAERVRFHQESWGLEQDGIAGQVTWSFLAREMGAWPLVRQGATQESNWRVLAAQHLLREHGATIAADGIFGPASGAAIRAFQQTQRAQYISTTVGQLDWPALIKTVRAGDSGEAVRAVQTFFPAVAIDGDFGPATDTAVREFQTKFAPPADGIVGPTTWHALTLRLFD